MSDLKLICKNNVVYADSRDVAELIDKRHADLCRDIQRYVGTISTNAKLRPLDFFVESNYTDKKGEVRRCYQLTKKGCDMVANKMTGDKGILFTATYIDKFYEMEARLKGNANAKPVDNLKAERLAVMKQNAKVREAKLWEKLAQTTENQTYKEICTAYAANTLAGKRLLELPEVKEEEKTYSAGDIGKMLGGVSASKVGRLANAHGLKTPQYGKFFVDKAKSCNKQVETFRYYITALPAFRKALRDDFHKKLDNELDFEFGEE